MDGAGTFYGGTLDVTTGVLTVAHGNIASYGDEILPGAWISRMDVYSTDATPTAGVQVVYELATPQTCQLTPQEVRTLLGTNNLWADCGDVSVTYRVDPTIAYTEGTGALAGTVQTSRRTVMEPEAAELSGEDTDQTSC